MFDHEYFRKYYRLTPEVALILVDLLHDRVVVERKSEVPHLQVLLVFKISYRRN